MQNKEEESELSFKGSEELSMEIIQLMKENDLSCEKIKRNNYLIEKNLEEIGENKNGKIKK